MMSLYIDPPLGKVTVHKLSYSHAKMKIIAELWLSTSIHSRACAPILMLWYIYEYGDNLTKILVGKCEEIVGNCYELKLVIQFRFRVYFVFNLNRTYSMRCHRCPALVQFKSDEIQCNWGSSVLHLRDIKGPAETVGKRSFGIPE